MVGRPTRKAVSDQEDLAKGWVGSRDYFRRGRPALPEGQKWLGGNPGGPGGVGIPTGGVRSPSQRAGRGWEALLEGREKSRVPPGGTIGVRSHPRWAWRIGSPSRRTGRVRSPFRSARMGREALAKSWEGLGGIGSPLGGTGGSEALQECQEGLGGPPGGLAKVGRPFWMAGRVGRDQKALPDGWEGLGGSPVWL